MTCGADRIKQAWDWNQLHKTGKWLLYSLDELAKALRSTNDRSLLNQMDAHKGCPKCLPATAAGIQGMEGRERGDAERAWRGKEGATPVDEPPNSAAPPVADPPALCHHNEPRESCQECEDEWTRREDLSHACRHGGDDRKCDECLNPRNAQCRNRNCKKWFHSATGREPYCSPGCSEEFKAREAELAKEYAKPPKLRLAAFLDGEEAEL
jgi:hypothetical protein